MAITSLIKLVSYEFIKNASKNGNGVTQLDVIRKNIQACLEYRTCWMNELAYKKDDCKNEQKYMCLFSQYIILDECINNGCYRQFYSQTINLSNMHKKSVMLTLAWNENEKILVVTKK